MATTKKRIEDLDPLNKPKTKHGPDLSIRLEAEVVEALRATARAHTKNRGTYVSMNKLVKSYLINGLKADAVYQKLTK